MIASPLFHVQSFYSLSADNPFFLPFAQDLVPGRQLSKTFYRSAISHGCMEWQVAEKSQP